MKQSSAKAKKLCLLIFVAVSLSACSSFMTTGDGISTTADSISTSFKATTKASQSSTGDDKDSSWKYDE